MDTNFSESNQQVVNKNKKMGLIIGIVFIVLVLIVGIFILRQPKKTEETKTPISETQQPSPTETPVIDKKTVKIQVLNGTGTPGQAGTAVEALKKAGYVADNIKTANAKEFTNTVTTIAVKEGFDSLSSDIKDALSSTFDTIEIDTTPLDKDSDFDIVVTTGGKKFEETTPTKAITPTTTSTSPTTTATPTSGPTTTTTATPTP
jgi:hypothetical protein